MRAVTLRIRCSKYRNDVGENGAHFITSLYVRVLLTDGHVPQKFLETRVIFSYFLYTVVGYLQKDLKTRPCDWPCPYLYT